jgi:epoxyqueuosine reductase
MSYNDEDVCKNYAYKIASYAQRKDYHYVIKQKLNSIISELQMQFAGLQAKAFVDTAPVGERNWAVKCGLGWMGKNSLLVTKQFGNKVFIGEIFASCTSDYGEEMKNQCGYCQKCIDACPNHAIMYNKTINSNLCISYQTIENKGDISEKIKTCGYIYGCDICLNACIWNKKANKIEIQDKEIKTLVCSMLKKIENGNITKEDFQKLRKISPMDRIKYEKLLSNIAFAKDNG